MSDSRMHYKSNELRQKASDMRTILGAYKADLDNLKATSVKITNSWHSNASETYAKNFGRRVSGLDESIVRTEEAIQIIERVADNIDAAESRALAIANE